MTIVIADDDADDRELLTQAIHEIMPEATVLHARDGSAALDLLSVCPADLLFLDINMPLLDGFGTLLMLRSDPAFAMLPVAVMSTSQERRDEMKSRALGADRYIVKPVTLNALIAEVQQALRMADGSDPARRSFH